MLHEVSVPTIHLIPKIDRLLVDLLSTLGDVQWKLPTLSPLWSIKDVVAHLIDGNLRSVSTSRDQYIAEQPQFSNSNQLISYLNNLNATWVNAAKRLSPDVLVELLAFSNKIYCDHLEKLDPFGKAIFPVAWAGEHNSANWFHVAREYTEKWHHQQQVRSAVRKKFYFFNCTSGLISKLQSGRSHIISGMYRSKKVDRSH